MKIWDTFMLRDELDLLQCRLEELQDVVDFFVIAEAEVTHGERAAKPLYLTEVRNQLWNWRHQIRYVPVPASQMPEGDPWEREHAQREACFRGMHGAAPGDLVLHGDLDEIPSRAGIMAAARQNITCVFEQRMTHYAVDWLDPELWPGTIACRYAALEGFQWLRAQRFALPRIADGGWHLSNLGTVEEQFRHLLFGCHQAENRADGAWDGVRSGKYYREGWHAGQPKLIAVDVDGSWPRYISERRCPASWFRPRPEVTS